eukprot:CAMPEP_0183404654 /NCGR_PEP_ID=MMETSP0370-20130417/15276_1 /TAXON_ID=268820 /ORGANISM="Peridinium aciculiferum, Strain PAER-2" /LENGTH=113 /DNA_ID=CAMNT_0025586517 /DNA_START=32 /DNA_END=374 /DNA_ORIENTATION=+
MGALQPEVHGGPQAQMYMLSSPCSDSQKAESARNTCAGKRASPRYVAASGLNAQKSSQALTSIFMTPKIHTSQKSKIIMKEATTKVNNLPSNFLKPLSDWPKNWAIFEVCAWM